MHHPTERIAHTMAFVTPAVEHWLEREIAQWVHPMKDQSDDPSHHEQTLYHGATSRSQAGTGVHILAGRFLVHILVPVPMQRCIILSSVVNNKQK